MSEQKQTQEQAPGLHPGNMPVRRHGPDSTDPRKTTPDLEDVTGNPGHVGINPNANPSVDPAAGVIGSINEPPQPPDTGLPSRPPGEPAPTPE